MKRIELYENSIHMLWEVTETGEIKLLHFSALPRGGESDIRDRDPVFLSGGNTGYGPGPGGGAAWS